MSALFLNAIELELLDRFNSFGVRYLVIGGHAVQFHGHLRSAKDLDIFVDMSSDNPSRIISALRSLGFPEIGLSADRFSKPKMQTTLGSRYHTELLTSPEGPSFEEAYPRRAIAVEEVGSIPVISYNDLLRQKRMLGRPQDIADVDALCMLPAKVSTAQS